MNEMKVNKIMLDALYCYWAGSAAAGELPYWDPQGKGFLHTIRNSKRMTLSEAYTEAKKISEQVVKFLEEYRKKKAST